MVFILCKVSALWKIPSKALCLPFRRGEVVGQTDIPLTLCGHTHAAQIKLFGWTPASWTFTDTDGRYDENDQTMYINVGLGCTLPVRLGANAEITVITLKRI